jgi:hypothetical protein
LGLWITLLGSACAQETAQPEPTVHAEGDPMDRSLSMAQAELTARGAQAGELVRCPEADLGAFLCYRADGRFVFIGAEGPLREDGTGDWYTALGAGSPDAVAEVVTRLGSERMAQLQRPTGQAPSRVSEAEWAKVQAPQVQSPPGVRIFTAWLGDPPTFAPYQVRIEASPGLPAKVSRARVESTLSPTAQTDAMLLTLSQGQGTSQKAAAEWLGQQKEPRAVPGLSALLSSKWNDGRRAAALALGQIGEASAVPALLAAARVEADPFVIAEMIRALSAIGGAEAKAALVALAAEHPDSGARAQAQAAAAAIP